MGSVESIRQSLEKVFGGLNGQLQGITDNLTMSPDKAFGGDFWNSLLHLGAMVIMPFAITLLCFFIAGEFYAVYVKANGEIDMQLVMTTVLKFVLPFLFIAKTYDLIEWIFRLFNSLIIKMNAKLIAGGGAVDSTEVINKMMEHVNELNWIERLGYQIDLWPIQLGMRIMSVVIMVIVYGRLFEIIIFWVFSPLPFSTLVHSEHHQIGINYLKLFSSLIFQGAIMFICVAMYVALVANIALVPSDDGAWEMLGYSAILIFCLVKTGSISKRMFGTF